ncbi:MAG: hypothetical protein M3Y12_11485 [Bacteroidota bacterium]|nr:hypothetical protein [Bacteroidota bacterium]
MKKIRLVAILLTVLTSGLAHAQQPSEAATSEQRLAENIGVDKLSTLLPNPVVHDAQNISAVLQNGNRNTAEVNQQNLALLTNSAFIQQIGDGNYLNLMQSGSKNSTSFLQSGNGNKSTLNQNGTNNRIVGEVDGQLNEVNITQDGHDNRINGTIRENEKKYSLSQIGNGNTLTQFESTNQTKGYSIEMRGNGMNITIEQSKVFPQL